jgi:hypothetical protein
MAGSDRGGNRPAVIYTLIQTAKLNDVDRAVNILLASRAPRARGRRAPKVIVTSTPGRCRGSPIGWRG